MTIKELHSMTMREMKKWVNDHACMINKTCVMCWGHETLFKNLHVKPEYLGYHAGRLIVETFRFTSKARKSDCIEFVEWLHWAIFGFYPTDETQDAQDGEQEQDATQDAQDATQDATQDAQDAQDATQDAQDAQDGEQEQDATQDATTHIKGGFENGIFQNYKSGKHGIQKSVERLPNVPGLYRGMG